MKNLTLQDLLDMLWKDYVTTNPPAQQIYTLFKSKGEKVVNDHVAFRTYNHPAIDVNVIGKVFTDLGYAEKDEYHFKEKKLHARHYEHSDEEMPLIFISQLKVEEFDNELQSIVQDLINQIPVGFTDDPRFICSGIPWRIAYKDYLQLKEASEYAAWLSAYGFRANHFTISINHLKQFNNILSVNQLLKESGFELNTSGGEVKGSPSELLEQSSTIAYNSKVSFSDTEQVIPACYYEFAKRYPKADGSLFKGFIAGSADKIFESTDKGQNINGKE